MKLAIIGYGKMGKEIERIARGRNHEIVCTIDVGEGDKFGSPEFRSADVAIEFSTPESAFGNYLKAFEVGVPVVSGTTGWLKDHLDDVKRLCREEGKTFFYASNFSVGVNVFFAVNRYLAKVMDAFGGYDVRMEETHHVHKLDAPSGTAITLAEDIVAGLERKLKWVHVEDGDAVPAVDAVPIVSFREGEVPGTHTVIYESDVDVISMTHRAKSRSGFALGAVMAAEFTMGKQGFLGMQDMLAL